MTFIELIKGFLSKAGIKEEYLSKSFLLIFDLFPDMQGRWGHYMENYPCSLSDPIELATQQLIEDNPLWFD